jgi:hypothetical protein
VSRAERRHRNGYLDELRQGATGCEEEVDFSGDAKGLPRGNNNPALRSTRRVETAEEVENLKGVGASRKRETEPGARKTLGRRRRDHL